MKLDEPFFQVSCSKHLLVRAAGGAVFLGMFMSQLLGFAGPIFPGAVLILATMVGGCLGGATYWALSFICAVWVGRENRIVFSACYLASLGLTICSIWYIKESADVSSLLPFRANFENCKLLTIAIQSISGVVYLIGVRSGSREVKELWGYMQGFWMGTVAFPTYFAIY